MLLGETLGVFWRSPTVCVTGDRYDERPSVDRPRGRMDEIDTWDNGANKSMAQEAIDKVKDFVSKVKGFDDTPDYW